MIRNLRSGVSTSATKTASVWAWVRLHPANSASSNLQSHALSKKILRGCLKFLPKEYASDRKKTHSRINRARARGSTDDKLLKERPIVFFGGGTSPFSLTGVVKSAFTWANFWLKGVLIFQQNFAWCLLTFSTCASTRWLSSRETVERLATRSASRLGSKVERSL